MVRVYEAWKGNNRFVCGGRFILGPDWKSFLLTLFLIISPAVLFFIFTGKDLIDRLSPAVIAVFAVFLAWDLTILLLTSARDPGVIPRNLEPPQPEEDLENPPNPYDYGRSRLPRTKDVVVNGVTVKVKYCDTCMLYRPPRTSHCSICNNCVERFDHHCPWVGQCIGKRNYRYFFIFVVSTTLMCAYVFAFSAVNIKLIMNERSDRGQSAGVVDAMGESPVSVVLMGYTFIAIWFVGGLTFLHAYLISTNQTTYENFRYRYDNKANPYNAGCLPNCAEVFCTPIPKSRNNFRAEAPVARPPIAPPVPGPPQAMLDREAAYKAANGGDGQSLAPQGYAGMQTGGHQRRPSQTYSLSQSEPKAHSASGTAHRLSASYGASEDEFSTLPSPGDSPPPAPLTPASNFYKNSGELGKHMPERPKKEIEMAGESSRI